MRTVTPTLEQAITQDIIARPEARLILERGRMFGNALAINYHPSSWPTQPTLINNEPLPQSVVTNGADYATVASVPVQGVGNTLQLASSRNASAVILRYSGADIRLLSGSGVAAANLNASTFCIFAIDSGGNFYRYTASWSAAVTPSATAINGRTSLGSGFGASALIALSPDAVVRVSGTRVMTVAVHLASLSWAARECPYRIIHHTSEGSEHYKHYSAAVQLGNDIFVYVTNLSTGEVKGVCYNTSSQRWSNVFTAVPADLTRFAVGSAFTANNKIHLVGQFERVGEFKTDYTYNLILHSEDGRHFSMADEALFSRLGYRFIGLMKNATTFAAACANRIIELPATFHLTSTPESLTISGDQVHRINASASDSSANCTVALIDESDALANHPLITKGSRARLFLGYNGEFPSEPYMTFQVAGVTRDRANARRQIVLQLNHDGSHRVNTVNFPFYLEIVGKSTVRDNCRDLSNLYPVSTAFMSRSHLDVDFWNCEPFESGLTGVDPHDRGGVGSIVLQGAHNVGVSTGDILKNVSLKSYPVVTGAVNVQLYCWSRGEGAGDNDAFSLGLIVENEDGEEYLVWSETSAQRPTRTYPEPMIARPEPLLYTFTPGSWPSRIELGSKIKKVVTRAQNDTTTETYFERVRFTSGIAFSFQAADPNTPWKDYTDPFGDKHLRLPGAGRPYIMFSTKPFDALSFSQWAEFSHIPGESPVRAPDWVAWGLVGLAADGDNYIVARFKYPDNLVQLVLVRDGQETVMAQQPFTPQGPTHRMQFSHFDGVFKIHCTNGSIWGAPILTYSWRDTDPPLFPFTDTVAHVGIYGIKMPTMFRICSFDVNGSVGVMPLPGEQEAFDRITAPSGRVEIDGVVYAHEGFIGQHSIDSRGPFQVKGAQNYPEGYGPFQGDAVDIAYFWWNGDPNVANGYAISTDNGRCGIVTQVNFNPFTKENGQNVYQYDRSRWFSTAFAKANELGHGNRAWTGRALRITRVVSGQPGLHPTGSWAVIDCTNEIDVFEYTATNGSQEGSLGDLLTTICALSGTRAEFPGDQVEASRSISPGGLVWIS